MLTSPPSIAWKFALGAIASVLLGASAAGATTFTFGLPSKGNASQGTPYPSVATLTLSQTADGVQFMLDPNESSPGFKSKSFIKRLDFVYAGSALDKSDFRNDGGVSGRFSLKRERSGMDAGFRADASHIVVTFPKKPRFAAGDTSIWTILGTTLDDFASFATTKKKPDQIFSVISVSGYSLAGPQKSAGANWVAAAVPEPGTAALLFAGLGGLGILGRRKAVAAPRP